jgi:hypothetical protein
MRQLPTPYHLSSPTVQTIQQFILGAYTVTHLLQCQPLELLITSRALRTPHHTLSCSSLSNTLHYHGLYRFVHYSILPLTLCNSAMLTFLNFFISSFSQLLSSPSFTLMANKSVLSALNHCEPPALPADSRDDVQYLSAGAIVRLSSFLERS